jgi:hypothetical protein
VYDGGDDALEAERAALLAEADALTPADCVTESVMDGDTEVVTDTTTCTGTNGVVVTTEVWEESLYDGDERERSHSRATYEIPSGLASWASLTTESDAESWWASALTGGGSDSSSLTWVGAPAGLPPDSSYTSGDRL